MRPAPSSLISRKRRMTKFEEIDAAAKAIWEDEGHHYLYWYTVDQSVRNHYLKLAQQATQPQPPPPER
jgi:hypothetical protein